MINLMNLQSTEESVALGTYLNMIENEDVRIDQSVNRESDQWDNSMKNDLIMSCLSGAIHFPQIIIGEEVLPDGSKQKWVIDGCQRSSTLFEYKYVGRKITSKVDHPVMPYYTRKLDEKGEVVRDANGAVERELKEFKLPNTVYGNLPRELMNKFNNYPVHILTYLNCTDEDISELVRLYNNHRAMNVSQKSLTYIPRFARAIKDIKNNSPFFIENPMMTKSINQKGQIEEMLILSWLGSKDINKWNAKSNKAAAYLNENGELSEIKLIGKVLNELGDMIFDGDDNLEARSLLTKKDTYLWMILAQKFYAKYRVMNHTFVDFMNDFANTGKDKAFDGVNWETLNEKRNTKDKKIVVAKCEYLSKCLDDYLSGVDFSDEIILETEDVINTDSNGDIDEDGQSIETIIGHGLDEEYLECCEAMVDDWMDNTDVESPLYMKKHRNLLMAVAAYMLENDIDDGDAWYDDFSDRCSSLGANDVMNYKMMCADIDKVCRPALANL